MGWPESRITVWQSAQNPQLTGVEHLLRRLLYLYKLLYVRHNVFNLLSVVIIHHSGRCCSRAFSQANNTVNKNDRSNLAERSRIIACVIHIWKSIGYHLIYNFIPTYSGFLATIFSQNPPATLTVVSQFAGIVLYYNLTRHNIFKFRHWIMNTRTWNEKSEFGKGLNISQRQQICWN